MNIKEYSKDILNVPCYLYYSTDLMIYQYDNILTKVIRPCISKYRKHGYGSTLKLAYLLKIPKVNYLIDTDSMIML